MKNSPSLELATFKLQQSYTKPKITDDMPRVVSLSGGRSSAMMAKQIADQLDPSRGDCIIFTNTSAEHIDTYRFIENIAVYFQSRKIPFFVLEFCTYERRKLKGEGYIRDAAYILRQPRISKDPLDDGMRWRGEVYEEMLSYKKVLPS